MAEQQPTPAEPPAPVPPAEVIGRKAPSSRRRWVWAAILILLAVGVYFLWPKITGTSTGSTTSNSTGKSGAGPAAVPVVAVKSRQGDIGVYFTGLGTVTPINTVTVKSRVDGQLRKVQYKRASRFIRATCSPKSTPSLLRFC